MDAEARAADPPIPIDRVGEIIFRCAAWLNTGCIVSPRVEVGAGTIVAAGNVVTRNLPPGVLAAGVPTCALRPIAASRHGFEFGNSLELKVV